MGGGRDWDELLPYVAMGYRISKQKSLGYSPYFLMFGKDPILQSRHQPMAQEPLDQEATAAQMELFLSERDQLFRRVMPVAFRNLAIAQQRDIERYRLVRGGGWDRPKANFKPGDYVLLRQKKKNCMQPPARPHILRVVELRSSGVVVLEGSDAARVQRQVKDISHSSLPILDPTLHPEKFYRGPNLHCKVCGCRNHPRQMVLCEGCNEGYHIWCMEPPLMRVPEDSWTCPRHSGTVWTHHSVAR